MKNIKALTLSTKLVFITTVLLTIVSEEVKPFKDFLAGLTGHHWVTKGVIAFVLFFVLYFVFKNKKDEKDPLKMAKYVVWTTVISFFIILLYYLWHFFG